MSTQSRGITPAVGEREEELVEVDELEMASEVENGVEASSSPAGEDENLLTEEGVAASLGMPPKKPVRLAARKKGGRQLVKPESISHKKIFTPQQRLLILDTWLRSGLPAKDFGAMVDVGCHTLYRWKKLFNEKGPEGLMDGNKGPTPGSALPDITKRAILMLKKAHPEYGCQRLSDMLARGPALGASASAVSRVLHEAGYVMEEHATHPHKPKVRSFERASPNQLWQTDLFTFMLKRQNRRVHLVAFMDDHSRFIVGYGLHATASASMVIEVFRSAITSYNAPEEVLTDNGSQYITWRGKSAFSKECDKQGIKQIVARPRRPQTLGKVERFWGTLWREFLDTSIFQDLDEARERIGLFIDHYNFQRPHRGIDGLVPADRFFGVAQEVLKSMKARIADNALSIAKHGKPKKQVYLSGQVDGRPFSLHSQGEHVVMIEEGAEKEKVDFHVDEEELYASEVQCPEGVMPRDENLYDPAPLPGTTTLEDGLRQIASCLQEDSEGGYDEDE